MTGIGERHMWLDAQRVFPRLWVGAYPGHVRRLDFTMWVQCAAEYGPLDSQDYSSSVARSGNLVQVFCPLHDDGRPMLERHFDRAHQAANLIDAHWRKGGRILVTCAQGRNRSAFVAAMALTRLTWMTSAEAIAQVRAGRQARGGVLVNPDFVRALGRTDTWARMPAVPAPEAKP